MTSLNSRVAVVGATTWGTTLAMILAASGRSVTLLARTESEAQDLSSQRQHSRFLPGITFPESLSVSSNISQAISLLNDQNT